jgi:hypothetical protein
MWKNLIQPNRPVDEDIIWFMGVACWITKATDKHSEFVIY